MKFDVCMWAKDGEKSLPRVLKRIDEVIPQESVNNKIFVDDSSKDRSVEIAKDFGWDIYKNEKGWINGGTEIALKHVKTDFFISVEQDVVLSKRFMDLFDYFKNPKVAVACGLYYPTTKYGRMYKVHQFNCVRKKKENFHAIGDNFYRTKIVREVGFVFDKVAVAGFYYRIVNAGYRWITDFDIVSDHIKDSFWTDVRHIDRRYSLQKDKSFLDDKNLLEAVGMVATSFRFLNCGNPVIPVLEAIFRFKFLEIYLKVRRNLGKHA